MLTPSIAQEIACETSAIIGFNVLITDRGCVVIGSGDTGRLGNYHEASMEVMSTLRPTSHGAAAASRLVGVQPGITLPIMLNGEAVGTVGITGDPDQVERFGRVVRNQTEILLRESLMLRSRLLRESAVEDLLRDIAHFDPKVTEPDFVAFKAAELGYELRLHRSVVVIDVDAPAVGTAGAVGTASAVGVVDGMPPAEPSLRSAVLRAVRRAFSDPQDLVGEAASGRFVVLHRLATAGGTISPANGGPTAGVVTACRAFAEDLVRAQGIDCRIGVGGAARSVTQLRDSYRDATNALYLSRRLRREGRVTRVDEVRTHDLLTTVAPEARARFVDAVAGPLRDDPDWPIVRKTVMAWCESGFNLVRASAALHVHRNTLVYRLDKIDKLAGAGVRDPRVCISLYLACLVDELADPTPS